MLCRSIADLRAVLLASTAVVVLTLAGLPGCGARPAPAPAEPDRTAPIAAKPAETPSQEVAEPAATQPQQKPAEVAGWGTLQGRFVYGGKPPERHALTVSSDVDYCCKHQPMDESLVVNSNNSGVANVVVAIYVARGEAAPPVHPSYAATASDKLVLDNLQCRFQPHVMALRTSQVLKVMNTDQVAHNTKIDSLNNPPINPTLPAGGTLEHRFVREERTPARVSCSIHPWMSAWIAVRDSPYLAVSNADGRFAINNLPAGTWTFQAWQEKARYLAEVIYQGKSTAWSRGRFTAEIKPDATTDLGEIRLEPKLFAEG